MSARVDLRGQRFFRLTVLRFAKIKDGRAYWLCVCDCGEQKVVRGADLRSGLTSSCGCWQRAVSILANLTHSHSRRHSVTSEYRSWRSMIQRCATPKDIGFKYYGGRGITVCDRWLHSFANFLADMGRKPSPLHSIDRFPNNDGNYEPGNCRWATRSEQNNNQRRRKKAA